MNKKTYIPTVAIFLAFSFLVISFGLFLADALPENVTYAINGFIDSIKYDEKEDFTQTGTEIGGYISLSRPHIPTDIHGAYVDLGTELAPFTAGPTAYNAFIAETESNFNYLKDFLTDTIFITPDYTGAAGTLKDAYGNQVDILGEYLRYADIYGYFKVLVINDSCIYQNGQLSFDAVRNYLRNYSFDAVLLSSASLNSQQKLAQAAAFFGKHVKVDFGGTRYFGIDAPSSAAARYADADTLAALESGFVDFAVVEGNAMKNAALPFAAVMNWWNAKAQVYPDITFYCKHRNDLVMTNAADWSNYIEICDQVRHLWNCENIKGSVFYNITALKQNIASASVRLSYLCNDGAVSDLSVNSIQFTPDTSSVVFTGTAAAGYKVLCNSKTISNLPAFTYTAALSAGENEFTFFSAGKSLNYRIYNNTRIIYDYAPQTDLAIHSGDTLIISAVCMEGADVRCAVNGKIYQMSEEYAASGVNIPEGYRIFACGVRFSGNSYSDLNLGKIVIAASVGENTETVTGAAVTVLKSETKGLIAKLRELFSKDTQTAAAPDQNQITFTESVSPYHDNGLGTALLCRIINDDTEVLGAMSEHDTYHADYSTLPEGTIDYISSMTVTESGYLRYDLKSGITVYGVNCELINNGYVLPKNRVFVNRVDDSSPCSTDIIFNMDWFSPVTVKCSPQEYSVGYQSYLFNVSAFTAQYVDVTFHYTGDFFNSSLLTFDAASPFSRSELYAEGDENLILRLYLKQPGQFYGFDLYRNDQNQLVLTCKKHADGSLLGKVIMLDPGHGGLSMTGTALSDDSVAEKTVTLAIAYKTKQMLESKGAQVLMTRTGDYALTLEERTAMQSEANPDIFVSIHCDGTNSIADSGTHTFYFRPYSQPLASAIHTSLTSVYQTYIYVPTDTNYAKVDKSIKYYPFFVTRLNHCPAVLVETGFMTNPVEGQILASDNAQYWIAKGISDGIEAYFANNHA